MAFWPTLPRADEQSLDDHCGGRMTHTCLLSLPSFTISTLPIEEADVRIYGILQLLKAEVVEHLRQLMIRLSICTSETGQCR